MSASVDLRRLIDLLSRGPRDPAESVEAIYTFVFAHESGRGRAFRMVDPARWAWPELSRAVASITEIAGLYAERFHDPRRLPVTHSRKQKRLAIHLDEQFGPVLREAVVRSGIERLVNDDGTPAADAFLDEPILSLKQAARQERRPTAASLRERFVSKLRDKGFRDVPPPGERFEVRTPG
jgi:hypothetical protein